MEQLFTAAQIRAAEAPLISAQDEPDELMRAAAHAVACAAADLLAGHASPRVVALVGSGGNGGDALYAAAELAGHGVEVTAVLCGSRPHETALAALRAAGATIVDAAQAPLGFALGADLALDGVTGIGGRPGLRPRDAALFAELAVNHVPVLAVDVPSGLSADTGATPEPVEVDRPGLPAHVAAHVTATATVTFGGLRRVHALHPACGQVLLADIAVAGHPAPLSVTLADVASAPAAASSGAPPEEFLTCAIARPQASWTGPARPVAPLVPPQLRGGLEPGAADDKYSGGVVGVLAGSSRYPGAGVLACAGALRATPSMVRYVGGGAGQVVAAHPEIIATRALAEAGRVQAWVVGPGRGTGEAARTELAELLERDEPVVIDADAVTLLAGDTALRAAVARHGRCVLTPHAGEFARLVRGMAADGPADGPAYARAGARADDSAEVGNDARDDARADTEGEDRPSATGGDRMRAAGRIAAELNATVLLKGRLTVVASAGLVTVVDAAHSWAATPGSGDVLSGVCGAWVARGGDLHAAAVTAVVLHARAAWLAAQTPDGPAPIVATDIAAALPRATAQLSTPA